jgi:transglutaminase-like putative cysteine protease
MDLVHAAEKKFPVNEISQELIRNANVVKRAEHAEFTILNVGATVYRHYYALTILNENGDSYADFEANYDKLLEVTSIEGALYDAQGNLLKKLKNKDVRDVSASDDGTLMDDSRKKTYNFYHKVYPYTVEYFVEEKFNNSFVFPAWAPTEGEKFSVEESDYTIIFPENYNVRYRSFNYSGEPEKTTEKGKVKIKWQVNSIPAFEVPFATNSFRDLATIVYFAPSDFEIEGYKGNMETWSDFGKFQASLNASRDELPTNIVQKVNSLTSGITDVKEKIKVLYEYFQRNTRYISIQLGIGGWQPFDATYVAEKGYGDCKALANYMHSLLKAANIKSNYTVVNSGYTGGAKSRVIEDFPCNQFNHVILCVPLIKDSMWLECTSQTLPAGYLSDFTANRKAVMITDEGGVLVSTPTYGLNENEQLRKIKARLEGNGSLQMEVITQYKCVQQDGLSEILSAFSKEKIQKSLERTFELATYDVNDFRYQESKTDLPVVSEDLNITAHNYATISGKRIFILPNILNRSGGQIIEDTLRKNDFVFDLAYRDKDEVEIELPAGYELESAPKNTDIHTKFGTYNATMKLEGNKIIYSRVREQFSGRFPVAMQKEIVQFFSDIFQADRSKVVLIKKQDASSLSQNIQ